MKLGKQITFGYALMFLLLLLISGFSIHSIYKLEKETSNIKGRYKTISKLLSAKDSDNEGYFANEMLLEAVKISDEQVKFSYLTIFMVGGIAVLFGGILTLFIPRVITKPILDLYDAAESVSGGDYSYRVAEVKGSGEIETLIKAFNHMLQNIDINTKELEKKNEENMMLLDATRQFNEVLEAKIEEATKEIKEKQEELIKSEKLATIGELASGIAHEVRNPLSGIAIALELMKDELANREHLNTIDEVLLEISRLERIVKGLFQLGHPRKLEIIECAPDEIVERAINLVQSKAKDKGVRIEKQLSCRMQFNVDHEQIEQVILNLLINGIEATDSFGEIKVTTSCQNGSVQIEVADSGQGIDGVDIDKILEPFYSTKQYGTGLGLAISNSIIEAHQGSIEVTSKKGEGARFVIEIPRDLTIS